MKRLSFNIRKSQYGDKTIYVSKSAYKQLKTFKKISFGTRFSECTVALREEEDTELLISQDLWNELHLPYENTLHIIPHEDVIHIGPLVGIFTAGFTDSPLRPVGDRSLFFAKLLEAEKTMGMYSFIFGAHQINWEKGLINGFFHTSKGWKQIEVPLPHVVYDRLPNRKTEKHETLQKVRLRMQSEYLIPWFNPGFFNKWEIHQIFNKSNDLKQYLPETKMNPSSTELKELLEKHKNIYLKPANGSLGMGIFQLIYSENVYYCRFRQDEKNYLRKYRSLDNLLNNILPDKSLKNYIAQQGIRLLRLDRKPIDFRVHTNKNEMGEWDMSAIAIKVAGRGSVTTHLRSGGEVKTIEEYFKEMPEQKEILHHIKKAVIRMSKMLDQHINGLIGEIGFDIGIDKDKNVWLFEANSKPGRSIFKHPNLRESDLLSRKLPMSYAIFLTEKSIKAPEELYLK